MALSTRISFVTRRAELFFAEDLAPEARSRELAAFARRNLKEAQEINAKALGGVPDHVTIVDGKSGGSEDAVRPDGVIVYDFDLLDDLFTYVHEMLVAHSPVLRGRYKASHTLYADGVEVDPAGPVPPNAREYAFLSDLPYARKIERGLSKQAPRGVYQVVAEMANKRFGNLASIRFSYRSPLSGYVPLPRATRWTTDKKGIRRKKGTWFATDRDKKGRLAAGAGDRTAHDRETETRVPAIIIVR